MLTNFSKYLKNNWIAYALLFTFSLLIYSSNINGQFVLDDPPNIVSRNDIRSLANVPQLLTSPYTFQSPESGAYRPLLMISIALNYAFFGTSTIGYHLTNILLHSIAGFYFFKLSWQLIKNRKISLLVAILFLSHPLHTEAVNSIVNRSEILAAIFAFLSLRYSLKKNKSWKEYLIINVSLLCAILSKESAIYLIPMLWLLQFAPFKFKNILSDIKPKLLTTSSLLLTTAIYFFLRYQALGQYIFANSATLVENPLNYVSTSDRVATALKILVLYLIKVVFPLHLSADYSFNQIPVVNFNSPLTIVGGIILFLVSGFWLLAFFKLKSLFISLSLTLLPYLITSNILMPIGTIMAERLMYTTIAGMILTSTLLLTKLLKYQTKIDPQSNTTKKIFILVFGFWLLAFSTRTFFRNFTWRSQYNLFTITSQTSPCSVLMRSNAGAMYILSGDLKRGRLESERAFQIYDQYGANNYNLGLIELMDNDGKKAQEWLERTIKIADYYSLAYLALSKLYYYNHDYQKLNELLEKYPSKTNHPSIQLYYILSLIDQNKLEQALQLIESKLPVGSGEYYHSLGFLFLKEGQTEKAHQALVKAININQSDEQLIYQTILSYLNFNDERRAKALIQLLNNSRYQYYKNPLIDKLCQDLTLCVK